MPTGKDLVWTLVGIVALYNYWPIFVLIVEGFAGILYRLAVS
jgi:hypothetical protein